MIGFIACKYVRCAFRLNNCILITYNAVMPELLGINEVYAHFQQCNWEQNPNPMWYSFVVALLQWNNLFPWFHFVGCFHQWYIIMLVLFEVNSRIVLDCCVLLCSLLVQGWRDLWWQCWWITPGEQGSIINTHMKTKVPLRVYNLLPMQC